MFLIKSPLFIQMPRYYSKRVKNPCGRCNYSCIDDCIQCTVCNRGYHRKCLKLTIKKLKELKDNLNFVFTEKCELKTFPFHSIGDKAFIATNTKTRFPCYKCTVGCHKTMNRIQCKECLRWAHLECIEMQRTDAERIEYFQCSTKCELNMLPFYTLCGTDFDNVVCRAKLNYDRYDKKLKNDSTVSKKQNYKKHSPEPKVQCEYLDTDEVNRIVNDNCPNDLTIFHSNVSSMRENMEKVYEIFQDCKKLPDILGLTETRLKKKDLKEFDIVGHSFKHIESPTQAGGTGIYIANHLDYFMRDDLGMGFDNCEDL